VPRFERKRKRGGNPQFQHPPIVPEHLAVPRPVFWRPGFGAGVDGADMEASPRIVSDALFELTYVRTCAQCRHRICSRTAGNILLPLLAFLRMNAPRGRFDWPHSTCRGLNVCPTGSRSFVLPPRPELGPPPRVERECGKLGGSTCSSLRQMRWWRWRQQIRRWIPRRVPSAHQLRDCVIPTGL